MTEFEGTFPDCSPHKSDGNWITELWVIPYNGLRLEMRDMYRAVHGLKLKHTSVTNEDLTRFFLWWDKFTAFVHEIFDVEEGVLRPWLVTKLSIKDEVVDSHVHLLLKLNQLGFTKMKIGKVKPRDVLVELAASLENFGTGLLRMCQEKETNLVSQVKAKENIDADRDAIEKDYWKAVQKCKDSPVIYVRSLTWMVKGESGQCTKWWKTKSQRAIKLKSRIAALKVKTKFAKEHATILKPLFPPGESSDEEDDSPDVDEELVEEKERKEEKEQKDHKDQKDPKDKDRVPKKDVDNSFLLTPVRFF